MGKKTVVYSDDFFAVHERGAVQSAASVVPKLLGLVSPQNVVDVGCGIGVWQAEFGNCGIHDAIGVDGDYVNRDRLRIDPARFLVRDLREPLDLGRRFDLAVSLEVAEHLPPSRAHGFISDLVKLAPIVLFSAAIPFQGGTFHVNEQWPDYWEGIFRLHNYIALDCLRPVLWTDEKVDWWYRQNIVLYASPQGLNDNPSLQRIAELQPPSVARLVHPRLYEQTYQAALNPGLKTVLRSLPRALRTAADWHLKRHLTAR